ncbi:uncharacterized protein [Centroberyx affinis]|uniref:uncharacterized protein n=1 Tax=Centroberyx affinis TaxID=166261 RepID=UPI003A5BF247
MPSDCRGLLHRSILYMDLSWICWICIVNTLWCFRPPAAAESQSGLSCSFRTHENGSASFQLSRPPRSPSCETCWEDRQRIVLARDSDFDPHRVRGLTNRSILLTSCLDLLTYREDCLPLGIGLEETNCTANCSLVNRTAAVHTVNSTLTCLGSWCPDRVTFGLGFGVTAGVLILGLVGFFLYRKFISKCRRNTVELDKMVYSYSAANHQIKMERGEVD